MPRLPTAPTAAAFAQAWVKQFKTDVEKAAGADGRISLSEARKLAESSSLAGDNVLNYLEHKGQKSVGVDVFLAAAGAYAESAAKRIAGPNGKVSLAEGSRFPEDLRADFFALRGKRVAPNDGPGALVGTQLEAAINKALVTPAGPLIASSVADYPVVYASAISPLGGDVTANVVKALFKRQVQAEGMFDHIADYDSELAAYELKPADVRALSRDLRDPAAASGFVPVLDVLKDNVESLRVFHIVEMSQGGPADVGSRANLILGTTKDGALAGVLYGSFHD